MLVQMIFQEPGYQVPAERTFEVKTHSPLAFSYKSSYLDIFYIEGWRPNLSVLCNSFNSFYS